MDEKLIRHLIHSFYQITVSEINKISKSVFLITTKNSSSNRYLFKFHLLCDQRQIDQINSIHKLLSDHHILPLIIPERKGLYISLHKNYVFSLQIFLERKTPVFFHVKSLFAKRLAELHNFLNSCSNISVKNHFDRTVTDFHRYALSYGYDNLLPIIDKVITITKNNPEQLIHGDLHTGNIFCCNNKIFFIDFDSMTKFSTTADVAFAAFRCYGMKKEYLYEFIQMYNKYDPPFTINKSYIFHFLVYIILQRIFYILIENEKGNGLWINDLENQKKYLSIVLKQLDYVV